MQKSWTYHKEAVLESYRTDEWQRSLCKIDPIEDPPLEHSVYVCYTCGKSFDTVKAYRRHQTTDHKIHHDAERYAVGGLCLACGTHMRTRTRLLYHLRYRGQGCLEHLARIMAPMEDQEVSALQAETSAEAKAMATRGHHPHKALLRAIRHAGPDVRDHRPRAVRQAPPPRTTITTTRTAYKLCPQFDRYEYHVILHLFSGTRRQDAFQAHLEN